MEASLPGWLTPIAAFAGLGAFVDFLIGRAGQNQARGFLETWWIRYDDVRWDNFGRKEAIFAIHLNDKWCGRRLFGLRRLVFITLYLVTALTMGWIISISLPRLGIPSGMPPMPWPMTVLQFDVFFTLASAIGLATSLSFTRVIAVATARLCGDSVWRNIISFTVLLIVTYILFSVWVPFIHQCVLNVQLFMASIAANQTPYLMFPLIYIDWSSFNPITVWQAVQFELDYIPMTTSPTADQFYALNFARACAGWIPNFIRLAIALIFVGSFVARPLLMKPVSLVWRRIVESDKPVFTLIFGGVSSVAVLVSELVKYL